MKTDMKLAERLRKLPVSLVPDWAVRDWLTEKRRGRRGGCHAT
jgi:hypothetical protein